MPPSPPRLSAKGSSKNWSKQQANVIRIFNKFCAQDDGLKDKVWEQLGEEVLAREPVYERFPHFMLHVWVIEEGNKNAGKALDGGTPSHYLGTLINLAADRFKAIGTDAAKLFFMCLDTSSTSEQAKWLRGLKRNLTREIFDRAVEKGEELDNSEGELWPPARLPRSNLCVCRDVG